MADKEEIKKLAVTQQLPSQTIREGEIDGTKYEFVTFEEALTEILETVRELKKKLC